MTRGMRKRHGCSKYQACTRKTGRWETKGEAAKAAAQGNREGRWLDEKKAYPCRYCKGYHIGSPAGR